MPDLRWRVDDEVVGGGGVGLLCTKSYHLSEVDQADKHTKALGI